MKSSDIQFKVEVDDNNIPEKINWSATDSPTGELTETDAIALSIWDKAQKNTLRIDLWTKDMNVPDMKRFAVDSIGGLAQTIESATGDSKMAEMMNDLCRSLVKHINKEMESQN